MVWARALAVVLASVIPWLTTFVTLAQSKVVPIVAGGNFSPMSNISLDADPDSWSGLELDMLDWCVRSVSVWGCVRPRLCAALAEPS
jgi:hypothetical protein